MGCKGGFMPGLEAEMIQELIACEKKITDPPKKEAVLKNRSFRNDMKLSVPDGSSSFSVFFRKSEDFNVDFSIGLIYLSKEGKSYTIFRCNGPHGETVYDYGSQTPHNDYHTHTILPGHSIAMEPSVTKAYGTYQDAIAYFIKRCNITGAGEHFPFLTKSSILQKELDF
jgi:hypothetical protein